MMKLKVQCKQRYHHLKFWQFNAYKKTSRRDYNKLLPGFVTSQEQRGEAMLCCFREEEEETRGARQNLLSIAILSSNDSNGFTSFKINVLKQRVSILFQASSCSAHTLLHLSLSLSLSLSFRSSTQLQLWTVPFIHLFSHSYEKCYIWTCVRLPYWIKF